MTLETVETAIIGAGVIGLAMARELAQRGHEVLIIEKSASFGTETSARNSEVIHAGIYYEPGSLKARLCREGRTLLYAFLQSHGVAHQRCGKLIVATADDQHARLRELCERAEQNGVNDLVWLSQQEARALEPHLQATAALLSPSTGIVDGHGLMLALLGEAQSYGALLATHTTVTGAQTAAAALVLETRNSSTGETLQIRARNVINAAGLWAPQIAASISGLPANAIPQASYAKGNYFTTSQRAPFSRLIYPVPEPGGLGIHLTLDLQGAARFGPDVEWCETVDYTVDTARAARFYGEIRRYWPALTDGALQPAYCGIRPKLGPPGAPAQDFRIDGPDRHGVPGLINLFGIESPGLTASLAIARHAAQLL